MAESKRVKKEEPDPTEFINSVNEEAEEKKAVEEAKARATDVVPPTPATNSKKPESAAASSTPSDGPDTVPSVERDMADTTDIGDDAEPIPLQADSGSGEIFPGVPCTTVARRCKKGDDDPAPLFLNRYGPRAKGWFVWSTTPALADGQKIEDLQNVSERFHRVLDFPREQGKPRYRASNVYGILNIVWDCEGLQGSPMEAAELLNPGKVKRAEELKTPKARRDWLQKDDHFLDKYPTTHMDVKFHQKINGFTNNPVAKTKEDLFTSWEVASQYKALYRKEQIKSEWRVYEAAQQQAKRFTDWYAKNLPEQFSDYRRSLSRDPTVQPFKRSEESASPAYGDEFSTGEKQKSTPSEPKAVPPPIESKANESPGLNQDQKQIKDQSGSDVDDDKLTMEELRDAALQGWCAANQIPQPNSMSRKDQLKFKIYFDVYSKNLGY
ncbi:uncharacterized protein HMPREF1541_10438 [Cyphellophora europaea CBS 101466]|uniref:Uncharacterized protein n=1 Tax=Cyphellophora europaea (strain CBS 101466) TaxID=1220924 RepID=W2S9Q3_CYPE1|nr:uncharacterized protein HMPREF1541_10438 [Cyphellophora europaea CBS 101466]ETN44768.1 hypothetical protein HMPREF1541_10438 [Cyphellophora europaea CBS 101466]